jgi:hypothetical protein
MPSVPAWCGGGRYEDPVAHAVTVETFGIRYYVLDLQTLIRTKRFAGRPKGRTGVFAGAFAAIAFSWRTHSDMA